MLGPGVLQQSGHQVLRAYCPSIYTVSMTNVSYLVYIGIVHLLGIVLVIK